MLVLTNYAATVSCCGILKIIEGKRLGVCEGGGRLVLVADIWQRRASGQVARHPGGIVPSNAPGQPSIRLGLFGPAGCIDPFQFTVDVSPFKIG